MKEYVVLWRLRWETFVEVEYVNATNHVRAIMNVLDESGFRPEQIEIIRVEENDHDNQN